MDTEENPVNVEDNQSEAVRINNDHHNHFDNTLVRPSQNSGYQPEPVVSAVEEPKVEAYVPDATMNPPVVNSELEKRVVNTPGLIVLQWLTYAFWGWTVLALSIVTVMILSYYIATSDVGDPSMYGIAAILVLLPISVICEIFFSKREPEKKTGASSIVMIIHAVIFALFGIGSLIVAVFSVVNLMISDTGIQGAQVALYSSLIIALIYAVVFFRTILPKQLFWIRRFFIIFMIIAAGILTTLCIIGPVAKTNLTRTDSLIVSKISYIPSAITEYTDKNVRLPDDLNSIVLDVESKKLVTDNLVQYTKNIEPRTINTSDDQTFYYQLCVTYKAASSSYYSGYSSSRYDSESDGYSTYLSVYSHPEGQQCYKLKTTVYSRSY